MGRKKARTVKQAIAARGENWLDNKVLLVGAAMVDEPSNISWRWEHNRESSVVVLDPKIGMEMHVQHYRMRFTSSFQSIRIIPSK